MAKRYKDAFGNEYERSAFGSYTDAFGNTYSMVSGGGVFLFIGVVLYLIFEGKEIFYWGNIIGFSATILVSLIAAIVQKVKKNENYTILFALFLSSLICGYISFTNFCSFSDFLYFIILFVFLLCVAMGSKAILIIGLAFISLTASIAFRKNLFANLPEVVDYLSVPIVMYCLYRMFNDKNKIITLLLLLLAFSLNLFDRLNPYLACSLLLSVSNYLNDKILLFTLLLLIFGLSFKKYSLAVYPMLIIVFIELLDYLLGLRLIYEWVSGLVNNFLTFLGPRFILPGRFSYHMPSESDVSADIVIYLLAWAVYRRYRVKEKYLKQIDNEEMANNISKGEGQ